MSDAQDDDFGSRDATPEEEAMIGEIVRLRAENEALRMAIKRQSGAARTLRDHTLAEVQHLKDADRSEYFASKSLDGEREANALLTEENDALRAERDAALARSAWLGDELSRALGEIESLDAECDRRHKKLLVESDRARLATAQADRCLGLTNRTLAAADEQCALHKAQIDEVMALAADGRQKLVDECERLLAAHNAAWVQTLKDQGITVRPADDKLPSFEHSLKGGDA